MNDKKQENEKTCRAKKKKKRKKGKRGDKNVGIEKSVKFSVTLF